MARDCVAVGRVSGVRAHEGWFSITRAVSLVILAGVICHIWFCFFVTVHLQGSSSHG